MTYRWIRLVLAGVALMLLSTAGTALPAVKKAGALPSWVHPDPAHKKVSLKVIAANGGANGTLNFNGYANGQMTVTVPAGWRVHIDFVNSGAGALPHSLEVIRPVKPLPLQGIPPAIPRAESRDLIDGIPPQQTDSFDFTAAPAGQYLWVCGFPSHGTSGMWDRFNVSSSAKAPSVSVK
jgi:sulfocyanin